MKFYTISDIHIKSIADPLRNNIENFKKVLAQIKKQIKPKDILIIAGDLFDDYSVDLKLVRDISEILEDFRNEIYIIVGNHSILMFTENKIYHCLDSLRRAKNVHIVDETTNLEINDLYITLLPFSRPIPDINPDKYNILFGHLDIQGFKLNNFKISEKGFTKKDFKKYDKIISGHYHVMQEMSNITYIGSPFPTNMSEIGEHYYWIFDCDTKEFEKVLNEDYIKYINYIVTSDNIKDIKKEIAQIDDESIVKISYEDEVIGKDLRKELNKLTKDNKNIDFMYNKIVDKSDKKLKVENKSTDINSVKSVIINNLKQIKIPEMFDIKFVQKYLSLLLTKLSDQIQEIGPKKIEFKQIRFKNFMKFQEEMIVDLTQKTLVVGPNYSGKSCIMYAIIYALWGKSGMANAKALNKYSNKNMEVILDLEINNIAIKIERYEAHEPYGTDVFITENGNRNKFQKTKTGAINRIQELLGMEFSHFIMANILSVENDIYYPLLHSSDRITFFSEVVGLNSLNILFEFFNSKLDVLEPIYKINEEKVNMLENIVSNSNYQMEFYVSQKGEFESIESKIKSLQLSEEDIKNYPEFKANYNYGYDSFDKRLANVNLLEKKLKDLNNDLKFLTAGYITEIKTSRDKLNQLAVKGAEAKVNIKNLTANRIFLRREILSLLKKFKKDIAVINAEIEGHKKSYYELKEHPETCIVCGNKISQENAEKELNKQKLLIKNEITKAKEYEADIKNKITELLKKKEDAWQKELDAQGDIISLRVDYSTITTKMAVYTEKTNSESINDLIEKISLKEGTEKEYNKKKKEISDSYNKLSKLISNFEDKIERIETYLDLQQKKIKIVSILENEEKKLKSESDNRIRLNNLKKDFSKIKRAYEFYKFLSDTFSNRSKSIKRAILSNYLDVFKSYFSEMVLQFFKNYESVSIDIDEALNFTINLDGADFQYSQCSYGTKGFLDLAAFFALIKVRENFGNSSNLIFVDEAISKGISKENSYLVLDFINNFSTNIFLITHDERLITELKDYNIIHLK